MNQITTAPEYSDFISDVVMNSASDADHQRIYETLINLQLATIDGEPTELADRLGLPDNYDLAKKLGAIVECKATIDSRTDWLIAARATLAIADLNLPSVNNLKKEVRQTVKDIAAREATLVKTYNDVIKITWDK